MEVQEITAPAAGRAPASRAWVRSARMERMPLPTPPPNKHELRTRETRELLLQAAQTIFIRDGYEGAELGEIAELAGRTKGAIYAQFKSKEDIFLALVETQAMSRRALMGELMAASEGVADNIDAMRKYVLDLAANDAWGLLLLEFRLFAVRHPEARERLRATYAAILPANEEAHYAEFLGPAQKGKTAVSRTLAVHSMFAIISSLQLEAKFDPKAVPPGEIGKIVARVFDGLFGVPESKGRASAD